MFVCFELIIFGGLSRKKKPYGEGCLYIFKMARALCTLFDSFILAGFPHLVEQRSHAEEGSYDVDILDASVEGGSLLSRAALSIDPISDIDVVVS